MKTETTSPWTACKTSWEGKEIRSGELPTTRRFTLDHHDVLALEVGAFPTLFNSVISSLMVAGSVRDICGIS